MSLMRPFLSALAAGLVMAGVASPASAERANPFQGAKTWGYQLRNLDEGPRKNIADSPYDLVVVDFARGEDRNEIPLTKDEVAAMQKKPDGSKRIVIAYLSIGETENYRYYWKKEWDKQRPSWMGKENKEWKANYLAKYWEPEWQKIIYGSPESYVDKVLAAGFDGFYFDRADAYYFFGDNADSRGKMVDFIVKLANYARAKKPGVGIMIQNAEELLDYKPYVEAIDGIAKESLLYGIKGLDKPNPVSDVVETTALLKKASDKGKSIFIVEYLQDRAHIGTAAKRINQELGWALYVGTRGLAQLGKTPLEPAPALHDGDEIGSSKSAPAKVVPAKATAKAKKSAAAQ